MRLFQNDSTIGAYSLKKSHYSATSGISVVLNDHPKYMLCWYYVSNIIIGTNTNNISMLHTAMMISQFYLSLDFSSSLPHHETIFVSMYLCTKREPQQ